MISQTAEYALRAMICLAAERDKPLTTHGMADSAHIPVGYLSKVMMALGRAGLVHSQRGPNGGFALTRSPDAITVFDVIQAVDPLQRIRSCPLHLAQHSPRLCPLHRRLDAAMAATEQAFGAVTLAELIREGQEEGAPPLSNLISKGGSHD